MGVAASCWPWVQTLENGVETTGASAVESRGKGPSTLPSRCCRGIEVWCRESEGGERDRRASIVVVAALVTLCIGRETLT